MATRTDSKAPWKATHPGTILGYELEERGITQKDFASKIGMQRSHLSELVNAKSPMTKPVAEKIEATIGIPSATLLNMQASLGVEGEVTLW